MSAHLIFGTNDLAFPRSSPTPFFSPLSSTNNSSIIETRFRHRNITQRNKDHLHTIQSPRHCHTLAINLIGTCSVAGSPPKSPKCHVPHPSSEQPQPHTASPKNHTTQPHHAPPHPHSHSPPHPPNQQTISNQLKSSLVDVAQAQNSSLKMPQM